MQNPLLSHKLLFITGKGGTGKSLLAASLALKSASLGKKVLIAENSSIEQIANIFGYNNDFGHEVKAISQNLFACNLNFRECFKEYVCMHLGMNKLYKNIFERNIVQSFLDAIPGLGELMLLGRLFHFCELSENPFDLVIFDSPATGHFRTMMETPLRVKSSGLGGPLLSEVERISTFLADPKKCGTIVVGLPESLVLEESIELITSLEKLASTKVKAFALNRMYTNSKSLVESLKDESSSKIRDLLLYKLSKGQTDIDSALAQKHIPLINLPELGQIAATLNLETSQKLLGDIPWLMK